MKHTVEQVALAHGALGLLINVPGANVVNFDFNFRAGDYLAPKGKCDTAHIMEHMVLGANKRYKSSAEYSKEFSKNGAYNNASTATYHMSYVAECAAFEAVRIVDLLCLAVEAPLFLESEFKAEKANVHEELKSRSNNHGNELSLRLGEAMGQFDLSYQERAAQLKDIELKDITDFYAKTHTAGNLRFIIAGDIAAIKSDLVDRVEHMALKLGPGTRIALPDEPINSVPAPLCIENKTSTSIYYRWETSFEALLGEADEDACDALFGILLGTMHSRIFGQAREQGLAYGIGYGKYRTRDSHLWFMAGQVQPENIQALTALICTELAKAANGELLEEDIVEAKQRALGNFQRGIQTVGNLVDFYAERFAFDDVVEEYKRVPKRIENLTLSSVKSMAKRMLASNQPWGLGYYGDVGTIDSEALYGELAKLYR